MSMSDKKHKSLDMSQMVNGTRLNWKTQLSTNDESSSSSRGKVVQDVLLLGFEKQPEICEMTQRQWTCRYLTSGAFEVKLLICFRMVMRRSWLRYLSIYLFISFAFFLISDSFGKYRSDEIFWMSHSWNFGRFWPKNRHFFLICATICDWVESKCSN